MKMIKYPKGTTYFIAYADTNIFAYGIVNNDQVMASGQPLLYTTTTEKEWVDELLKKYKTRPE